VEKQRLYALYRRDVCEEATPLPVAVKEVSAQPHSSGSEPSMDESEALKYFQGFVDSHFVKLTPR
jgi:hypothetical protein